MMAPNQPEVDRHTVRMRASAMQLWREALPGTVAWVPHCDDPATAPEALFDLIAESDEMPCGLPEQR